MKKLCVSIDRRTKKYAIFDGLTLVQEFTPYMDEAEALAKARAKVAELTTTEPDVVYPRITSMRVSGSLRRK